MDVYLYDYRDIWIINKSPPGFMIFKIPEMIYLLCSTGLFSKLHSYILSAIIISIIIAAYRNQIIGLQFTWFSINLICGKIRLFETLANLNAMIMQWQQSRNMVEKKFDNIKYIPFKNGLKKLIEMKR